MELGTHPGITWLDRALRRSLEVAARISGYQVHLTVEPTEEEMRRLHQAIHGCEPPTIPAELQGIAESYARGAAVFVARHRGRPVGILTLFQPTSRCRTTDAMGVRLPDGVALSEVLDIGQLAVTREHRGGARFAILSLLAAVQRHTQLVGRTYWIGATSPGLVSMFRSMNPSLVTLEADPERSFDAKLARYWDIYRGGKRKPLVPFIMENDAASPTSIVLGHLFRRIAARLRGLATMGGSRRELAPSRARAGTTTEASPRTRTASTPASLRARS